MDKKTTDIVPIDSNRFAVAMPDHGPALGFDPADPAFTWRQIYRSSFWNMDELEERRQQLGGWPVLTPQRVLVRPVFDPSDLDGREPSLDELRPKLVLEFVEAAPALVLNKSRCELLQQITGTPNPTRWAALLGPVELSVAVLNKKAQIAINPAPAWAG